MLAVVHASQLVTLRGPNRARHGTELERLGIIQDGGLLVEGERIVAVGTSAEIESRAGDAEIVDASGKTVFPGFIDAHTHFVFAGNRLDDFEARARGETYEQVAARGGGIRTTVSATRALSESKLFELARQRAQSFLRNGTTTVEAKSGYGLTLEDELKILRVIQRIREETPLQTVPTFLGAHAVPPEMDRAVYVSLVREEMLPLVAKNGLAEYCDVFCETGYFTPDDTRQIVLEAARQGLKARLHVDQLTNSGGAELAAELKAATADHLEQSKSEGIAALARARVQPVLLPGSVYALGKTKYPDARAMIAAGLPIVLATDFNPGSSPTPSIPMILSLAVTQMKLSPAEALTAVTMNAAASLGRADEIGSLEEGKLANFVLCDCADFREIAFWFGISLVSEVFVRGKRVV